ncbi:hypothetical protein ATY30_26210 [Sinorhizobium americanum]|uniref:hypothetical protein n=1 Tax=Sinorhizobium americanum TaxID=194963 RepID=UPI000BEB6C9E|nr:hypothetical protein [Sinorhizobium americanum]PDT51393.1 hypothetical protein CO664_21820 [Sinorhizobium sp. NG07B]POH26044.1 hypothetical protein ATY30_26210 [Sinorhizobium americanum]
MLAYRNFLLRFDAAFLLIASTGGMTVDIAGSFLARGPEALLLNGVPGAAIGFIEAHGLAFILGVMLWRAGSSWHVVGAAVHLLLGMAVFHSDRNACSRLHDCRPARLLRPRPSRRVQCRSLGGGRSLIRAQPCEFIFRKQPDQPG